MPFDESLLRDEPSGFDESLLRDEEPIEITPPPTRPYGSFRRFADLPPAPPSPSGPTPEEWLSLPPEEQTRLLDQMNLAETARLRREALSPSRAGTIAREAVAGAGPALAAGAGFAAGAPLGAPLGPFGMIATGTGGAILAGSAASDLQDLAAQAIAPEDAARFQSLIQAGREEFPYSAVAGRLAGAIPSFQVSLPRTAMEVAKRSALGAGIASVPAVTEGRLPTGAELLEGAVGGVALGDPRLKALRVPITTRGGEPDASRIREATEVYGDVRPQPVQGQGQVPAEVRGERVQPQTRPLQEDAPGRAVDDLTIAQESNESIVNRTQVSERDEAFANRSAAANRVSASLKPGDKVGDWIIKENLGKQGFDVILKNGEVAFIPGSMVPHIVGGEIVELSKSPQTRKAGEPNAKEAQKEVQGPVPVVKEPGAATTAPGLIIPEGAKPEAVALAKEYAGRLPELEKAAAEAQAKSGEAVRKIKRLKAAQKLDEAAKAIDESQDVSQNWQRHEEAVNILKNQPAKPVEQPVPVEEAAPAPAQPAMAIGIAPPGTEQLQDIIAKAIAKPKDVPHPIQTDVSTPLPDFQEHGASKKIFAQPFGFERIPVLGAFLGGTRRLAGHVNDSLTTYWNERQVGRAVASAFGNQYKWLDDPFTIVDGQITNIEPTRPNQSRYISDVFENLQRDPTSYRLTPEQQRAFDAIQAVEKDFNRLESKYDIAKRSEDEGGTGAYFPRIVTSRPAGSEGGLRRGQAVGTKAFFEKERMFDTEAQGWEKGYKYEPSIVNRLATRAERLYKRMADKRLAEDKSLGGTGRKELEAQLKETYAEEVASGEMTEAKISQMADSLESRGRVFQPAFFNKIFPEETAKALNKAFPNTNSGLLAAATSVNNAIKGLKLGFDLGVGFIQGQATLARYPVQWGKAIYHSVRAFPSADHFPGYVRENIDPIRELAQLGSSVGHLEEYMAGLGRKEVLGRIPGVGAASRAFGRQFSTFLDVAKVEIWKAYRNVVPKEQWNDVVQSLESVLMSGRMESTGISGKRAMAERALLLAPSYYRGGLNLIGAMAEKGVSGQIARQALGAYAVGGAALFYGVAKALGMDEEDIKKRFNPARSDFLMWRVKHGDKASEIGFGGFFRSLLRLSGNIAKTSIENPGNWKSLDPKKNPIVKWYRGHAGPVVSIAWDMFSGKDYLGRDTDIGSIGKAITPLSIESAKGTPGQPQPSAVDVAASVVGLSGFPASAQPSTKETFVNIHNWMAKSEDPKVQAEFTKRQEEEYAKPYAPLRQALAANDIKAAGEAYTELLKTRKPKNIISAIRPFSRDRDYVRHDKPLTGSKELERKFLESLSDEDRKLYDAAKKERMELWTRFQKVLEARKD